MLDQWAFIAIFGALAFVVPVAAIVIGRILGPRRPNKIQQDVYECGIEAVGEGQEQLKVQYYLFTLVFLVFDVEIVLLLPWALAYQQLPLFALVAGVTFIVLVADGLVYAWRKGALEWK